MKQTKMPLEVTDFEERYQRQLLLPEVGSAGQKRLAQCHVAVIGAGGLGSTILPLLVGAGVGCITLCDGDRVSLSNLPRQTLYTTEDLGRPKVACATQRLRAANPHVTLRPHQEYVTEASIERLLSGAELIIDACDNEPTRHLLDVYASSHQIPWLYASLEGWQGQVALFTPKTGCYADLFPASSEASESDSAPSPIPVLASTPAIVASIATAEALKYLLHLPCPLAGRLLLIDSLRMTFQQVCF